MKNIWRIFIVLFFSLCMVSSVSADSETLDIDWSDVEMTVSIEASSGVIAVSGSAPSSTKYNTTVTLTGALTGEPQYNTVEYEHTKTEWLLSVSGLTLNSVTEGKLGQWQEASTAKCTRYGTSSGKVLVGGTVTVKYTFTKIDDSDVTVSEEFSGSVSDGTEPGTEDERATVWVIGVGSIQYKKTTDTAYSSGNSGGTGSVASLLNKGELDFKAIRDPSNSPSWPSGFPTWRVKPQTGSDISHGSGETKRIKFEMTGLNNTPPDNPETQKVTAQCGSSEKSLNVEVFVYKVWISSYEDGSETNTSLSPVSGYGIPAAFTLSRDRSDEELVVPFTIKTDETSLGTGKRRVSGTDYNAPSPVSVTFEKGKTVSEKIEIKVKDDNLYEGDEYLAVQLTENKNKYLLISKNEAGSGSGGGTGTSPDDQKGFHLFKIADNDVLELFKIKYTGIKGLKPDPGAVAATWGNGPHWLKGKPLVHDPANDAGYVPAAYAGGTKVNIEAYFNGKIDTDPQLDVYSYFDTTIAGAAYASEKNEASSSITKLSNESSGNIVKGTYVATANLQEKVAYESALSTKFTYQLKGEKNKKDGTSTSCLYVTRSDPGSVQLYHTVVHLGCAAAHGKSVEQEVFDAIWAKFAGNNICISKVKIEGGSVIDDPNGKLYYYGISATLPTPPPQDWPNPVPPGEPANQYTMARKYATGSTQHILTIHDGRCGAWQSFVIDITNVHGLATCKANIYVQSPKKFLYAGNTKGSHYGTVPFEKSWHDHAVMGYEGSVYDTSYGENYGELNPLKASDMVALAQIFEQFAEEVTPSTTPKTYIWESSVNAQRTWITVYVY